LDGSRADCDLRALLKREEVTFLKKSNQKTFAPLRAVLKQPGTTTNKVFMLLFVHKKKFFF
jgi:hypothetical protein